MRMKDVSGAVLDRGSLTHAGASLPAAHRGGGVFQGPASEWLGKQRREYSRVVQDMELMAEQSRRVTGASWYLYLHHRKSTGQKWLQWRSFGLKHVHMTWDRIQPTVETLPKIQRDWFINANERMEVLNAREVVARKAIAMAEAILAEVAG